MLGGNEMLFANVTYASAALGVPRLWDGAKSVQTRASACSLRSPTRVHTDNLKRDQAIANAARRTLRDSSYPAIRRVTCDSCNRVLTLHGRVFSYFLKQVAQTAVRNVEGIRGIVNRLEVADSSIDRRG